MNEEIKANCTGFLFSDPSLIKGMGTIFNIWGNYYGYNYSNTPQEADQWAIASDWRMVGKDMEDVLASEEISEAA
jgi:hypothetical protein